MIAVGAQTMIFLQSLLLGAGLGMAYDLFRVFRLAVRLPAAAIVAEDLLYFSLCAAASFSFAMTVNYGQVRFFILLGEALGFVIYYFTVGTLVMKCAQKIIAAIKWLAKLFWKLFLRPPIRIFCWFGRKWKRIFGKMLQKMKKSVQMHRKRLQIRRKLLYNYFKK